MSALNDNLASEAKAPHSPASWFAENVHPWLWAAQSTVAILTYRETLRLLLLARQLGW
ncbi:MAG TPA: hypothetical protein VGU63_04145 [Candidatus Acidoferrales bacterium]|nr:hypothetical protein [Candidatus Acidoferrales bacterium]